MADSDRDAILESLRATLRPKRAPFVGDSAIDTRLRERPIGPQPSIESVGSGSEPLGTRLNTFTGRLEAAAASWDRVADPEAAVAAIIRYMDQPGGARPLIAADHPALRTLPWPPGNRPRFDPVEGDTPAALTLAHAGIAETGSLILCSTPETPTGLNFLPDILICLLPPDTVVDHLEDAWTRLLDNAPLPRAVNLVTGPSRTADVEQTLQLGAHGPRHLHVVLVESGLRVTE